jgi:hypothetical protein
LQAGDNCHVTHEYASEYDIAVHRRGNPIKEVFAVPEGNNRGIFENCTILFFIILFLLLFWRRGFVTGTDINEIE